MVFAVGICDRTGGQLSNPAVFCENLLLQQRLRHCEILSPNSLLPMISE